MYILKVSCVFRFLNLMCSIGIDLNSFLSVFHEEICFHRGSLLMIQMWGSGWYTRGLYCQLGGLWHAGEMVCQEPHEVQQGEV